MHTMQFVTNKSLTRKTAIKFLLFLFTLWDTKKVGAYDRKIAGTADSKHSTFKCLVISLHR